MKLSAGWGMFWSVMLAATQVYAAPDLQREIEALKEDVKVLQRQMYRHDDNKNRAVVSANSNVQVKIGEYDEIIRKVNGRMDELEYQAKQIEEKLDKINRDMNIRFKILEGRQVPDSLAAPVVSMPTVYAAPVANGAAKAVVGDTIQGSDLAPISGSKAAEEKEQPSTDGPQSLIPEKIENTAVTTANPLSVAEMYATGLQAYEAGHYEEAEIAFEHVLKQNPQDKLAGNAQYWLGEVYVKQNDLKKAKLAFKTGYEKYKNGNKSADSLFKLGVTMNSMGEKKNACIVFMSFAEEFPKVNAELSKRVKAESKRLGCK